MTRWLSLMGATALALTACASSGEDGRRAGAPAAPSADTILMGAPVVYMDGVRLVNTSSCTGDSCLVTIIPGSSQTFRVQHVDFRDSDFFGISDRQRRNGVRVAKVAAAEERAGALTGYGAWGQFNAALYGVESIVTADATTSFALTASSGTAAGSNPVAGAATWSGAMVGVMLEADDLGEAVMGDADLAVDFSSATLDLALTEIAGISTGAGERRHHLGGCAHGERRVQRGKDSRVRSTGRTTRRPAASSIPRRWWASSPSAETEERSAGTGG